MLTVHGHRVGKFCDGISRRDFLKVGSIGLGALTLTDLFRLRAQGAVARRATQKSVIMVYLHGGPPHIDMYDMKPDAPAEYRGLFRPIQTNVTGMQICELMPRQAPLADKFSIVRNMTFPQRIPTHNPIYLYGGELGTGADQITFPAFGSVLSKLWSDAHVTRSMPGYVSLDSYDGYTSFLGSAHRPFIPAPLRSMTYPPANVPLDNMASLDLAPGMTFERVQDRTAMLRYFDTINRELDNARGSLAGLDASQHQALAMLTDPKVRDAFDTRRESLRLRERYGKIPQLLLARRLAEAGVPLVQLSVSRNQFPALRGESWDTHNDNFGQMSSVLPKYDQAISTFISDLYDRGLNNDVLAVIWGEMGRTPRVNNAGGRDHWPQVGFAMMVGGGLKMGQVVGATDARAELAVGPPYNPHNVLAMIYRMFGIDVERTTIPDASGRPRFLLQEFNPIAELL